MSDGREERKEQETLIEQEKGKSLEERVDHDETMDEWEPERVDS